MISIPFYFYSLNNVAQAIVGPMTNALIGKYMPLGKRASAINPRRDDSLQGTKPHL